jgi:Fructose-2,6-bisphosphatase
MLELTLVRHGETDANRKGAFLGWTDPDLNQTGIRQAYIIKNKLANQPWDAVFSSPLKRAFQTAQIINEPHKLKILISETLKERNFGIWDNLTLADIQKSYPSQAGNWLSQADYPIPEGEDTEHFNGRIERFVDELLQNYSCGRILAVCHGGGIRIMLASLLGLKKEDCWRFKVDTGSIAKVELNEDRYAFLTLLNG